MPDLIHADATAAAICWTAITPDDATPLDPMPRALFVGVGGTLALEDRTGSVVVWTVMDGQFLRSRRCASARRGRPPPASSRSGSPSAPRPLTDDST